MRALNTSQTREGRTVRFSSVRGLVEEIGKPTEGKSLDRTIPMAVQAAVEILSPRKGFGKSPWPRGPVNNVRSSADGSTKAMLVKRA